MLLKVFVLTSLLQVIGASDWHMILGGQMNLFETLKTVELFNWRTGQQCSLGDLPTEISAHSGTELGGVPVYCGGVIDEQDQKDCYKYNAETDSWDKISDLLQPISWAGDVLVPDQGWVVFGGGPKEETTAQKLTSVDGAWEEGPQLFNEGSSDHGLCAVQISDTVSGFFGGNVNNHSIVTYDWASGTYTKQEAELVGERLRSSCAVMTNTAGEKVVAVVGSDSHNSKGMEVWNPTDNSLSTLHDSLPHEEANLGLDGSQMVSVDDGAELVLYGGFAGEYLADIWKYNVAEDAWVQIGNMTTSRYGHLVIPVTGVTCPE